jgi:hypothetical protein
MVIVYTVYTACNYFFNLFVFRAKFLIWVQSRTGMFFAYHQLMTSRTGMKLGFIGHNTKVKLPVPGTGYSNKF